MPHGTLAVRANVADGEVYIDSNAMGYTSQDGSLNVPGLRLGNHQVLLRKAGYVDFGERVVIGSEGSTIQAKLILDSGSVTITQNSPNAVLTVSGHGSFENTIPGLHLPSGSYIVTARAPGYTTASLAIKVTAGSTQALTIPLEPLQPPSRAVLEQLKHQYVPTTLYDEITGVIGQAGITLSVNRPGLPPIRPVVLPTREISMHPVEN